MFDLAIGEPGVRPDAAMGYAACEAATSDPVAQGTVGGDNLGDGPCAVGDTTFPMRNLAASWEAPQRRQRRG